MEFFTKIQWDVDSTNSTSELNAEHIKTHSVSYKILHNDFIPLMTSSSDSDGDEHSKNMKGKTKKKPVQDDEMPLSNLSSQQHDSFLIALEKMQENKSQVPPIYRRLEVVVKEEQQQFLDYLKDLWQTQYDKHNILPDGANKFVIGYWKHRLKRIFSYPQLYKSVEMVPLVYTQNVNIIMEPCKVLLEMGIVPNFQLPSNVGFSLCTEYSKVIRLDKSMIEEPNTLHKVPPSNDTNAEHLALQTRADIVISSSGLQCIASNVPSNLGKSWDIPVTVKKYCTSNKSSETATFHKVVYIDKVLPPKNMNRQEKNWLFHKIAIRKQMCNAKSEKSFIYPMHDDYEDVVESDMFSTDLGSSMTEMLTPMSDVKDLCAYCKTYSTLMPTSNTYQFSNNSEKSDGECSSDSDNLIIVSEDEENKNDKFSCVNFSTREENKQVNCTCGKNLYLGHKDKDASIIVESCKSKEFKKTPPSSESNITYRLWKLKRFHEDKNEILLKVKNSIKELKVLVRCKIDACESVNNRQIPLCMSSKLEYQAEHGAEKMNLSALVREWTALFIRPETSLTRVRIDASTEKVVMTERVTIQDVVQQAMKSYNFRIKKCVLGSFFSVFDVLTSLEPGQYILSHCKRNGSFASLLQHSNDSCSYDLYGEYETVKPDIETPEEKKPPWIPIDTNVITPSHLKSRRIPATFMPYVTVRAKKKKNRGRTRKRIKPEIAKVE